MKKLTLKKNPIRLTISKNMSFFAMLLFLLFLFAMIPHQINAQPYVVGVDPSDATIQSFDAATWLPAGPIVDLTMPPHIVDGAQSITFSNDNLLYYAIIRDDNGDRHLASSSDPSTGVFTSIGILDDNFSSLTYNSHFGVLYGMTGNNAANPRRIYSLNITTAEATFLGGPYTNGFGHVIAYNFDDQMIYHWTGETPNTMEKISPVTFLATAVTQSGDSHGEITGAVYLGGDIFAATDLIAPPLGPRTGYSITSTGEAKIIEDLPYLVRGLAIVDEPLPVELASFTSSISGREVTLNWATSSELNNSGFDVERRDARGEKQDVWTKIGSVAGNGTTTSGQSYSFTDRILASGNYNYRLKQTDFNGNFEYFALSNEVNVGVPTKFDLSQNYPNPFNPSTQINYDIPFDGKVSIKLFDMAGKEVATLVNEVKTAGYHSINFNASNLSSGVYFYSLSANNFTATKKMLLVK